MMSKEEAEINREMLLLSKDQSPLTGEISSQSEPRKLRIVSIKPNIPDLNAEPCFSSEGEETEEMAKTFHNLVGLTPHNAGHVDPKLSCELEVEILARLSCFEYWKLQLINKQFSQLLKSSKIFKVRKERGLVKPYVIMHWGADSSWKMFDEDFENFRVLPVPSDEYTFLNGDKQTISAGTQLIVIGREGKGVVVFRYDLENHKWLRGPSMIMPRVMYGSASNGNDAFFAGGIQIDDTKGSAVVNIVEKYNSDTKMWTMIHGMHKRRTSSSGCFLHGKFYVLGGRDEKEKDLTSGECYDEATNSWELIPDMLKGIRFTSYKCPPLIAVVEDNLYLLETSSNKLCVYDIYTNVWKKLGVVPVNTALGWGIAFKSTGDRLLLVGPSQSWGMRAVLYTCHPSPDVKEQLWEETNPCCSLHQDIKNCCVMFA